MKTVNRFVSLLAGIMAATGKGYRRGSMRNTGRPIFDWKEYKHRCRTAFGFIYPRLISWDRRKDKFEHSHGGRFEKKAFRSYRKGFGL